MKAVCACLLGLLIYPGSVPLFATTKTWTGGSSGSWATAGNWGGGIAPVAGDDLVFPGGVTRLLTTNNFSPNRAFNSLTILGTNYFLRGNPLILTNGISMGTPGNTPANPNTNVIEADIQLQAAEAFRVTNLYSKLIISGNVLLNPGCLEVSGSGNIEISGIVSGGCGITKSGFGFLTLSGDNSFDGTVLITGGRIIAEDPGFSGVTPLGSTLGGTILQNGLLEIRLNVTNEALTLSGGDLFNNHDPGRWQGSINVISNSFIDYAGKLTIDGVISGDADLEVNGLYAVPAWDVTFTGGSANTLTGEVWLGNGRLVLDKPSGTAINGPLRLGGGSITNAVVRENQSSQIAVVPVTVLTNAVLDLDGHSDGIGSLTLVGGVVTNNGTGLFTINGNVNAAYASRRSDIYGNVSLGIIARTFFITNSDDTTGTELNIHDEVRGTAGLIKDGDGYMGLLSSNSYSGLTTVRNGTLLAQDDFALGTTNSGTVVSNGATLYVASSTIAEPLTLNGFGDTTEGRVGALRGLIATCSGAITLASDSSIDVPSASPFNLTISGPISGPGGVTKTGPGTLIYSGTDDNVYTGDTLISAGILLLNKSGAYAINNSASLVIGDSSDGNADDIVRYNAGGQLRTTMNILINRTGVLDLNNFTDDIGDINMVAGTIQTGTGTLQLRGNLTAIGDSLNLTPYAAEIHGNLDLGSVSRTFTINNNSFALGVGTDLYIDAAVTVGSATWTKTGPGEMELAHSNSFTGALVVRDGRLIVSDPNALGSTANGTIVSNSANLELSGDVTISGEALTLDTTNSAYGAIYSVHGTNTWNGPITLSRTAVIFPDLGAGIILSDAVSGSGGVTKIGRGLLTYSGSVANNYSGTTIINEGTLLLARSIANNSIVGPLVIGDGAGGVNADVLRLQGTSQIGSLAPMTINSSGLFDLNGITENFGSLAGSGNVTLGGATINVGADGTSTSFSGLISETGNFAKSGSGTMTLSGANTYTGTTTVSAGTLLVNGSQPQSPVSVASSGTLGGTGTVGIIVGNGGVAPGASPGILTSSNLSFSSSGDFFVELTGPTAGTDYDQLNVRGTNNLGSATLHVIPTFSKPVSPGQQFTIINNDGTDAITGTFAGMAENSGFSAGGFGFRINYAAGSGNDVVLTLTNIPTDFYFTNVLGGDFLVASNWIPFAVPAAANNANFTNNATYTVTWSGGVTNANAFFNASSGNITEAPGTFAWQLTNSYIVGQNPGAVANVTHASGTLRVTNAVGTASLDVRRGTNRLNAGLIEANRLWVTNAGGFFEFNGGTLITRGGAISNNFPFNVGANGSNPALWDALAGIDMVISSNIVVGAGVPGCRLIMTNGAKVINNGFRTVGLNAGSSNNAVLVSGAGSVWSNSSGIYNSMMVGESGSFNLLAISNSGAVYCGYLNIGYNPGSISNAVVVSGTNSLLAVIDPDGGKQELWLGDSGSFNLLAVSSGGRVVDETTGIAGSSNSVIVTGGGSVLTNYLLLELAGESAHLIVSNGAMVASSFGYAEGNGGLIAVSGVGTVWSNRADIQLGNTLSGNQLLATNSGTVKTASLTVGDSGSSTNNRCLVDHATLTVTNATQNGVLNILHGTNLLNNAGWIEADLLRMTNTLGRFEFNGGTNSVRSSTVANGQPFVVGNAATAAAFNLVGGGLHSFADGLTIRANAFLLGNGSVTGALTVLPGGTLAPGASVGRIALSNSPFLSGSLLMEISKTGSVLTNDQLKVTAPLTYAGTLTVTSLGPDAPAPGDRFPLFNAPSYAGAFSIISLPSLDAGLVWTNKLLVDGSIQVVTAGQLQFSNLRLSGANLILSGSGGFAGSNYAILSSTNVLDPLSNWVPLATNQFDSSGNFSFTNDIASPQRFFMLRTP